jgi:translation elongation factor EF-Tu-like GTPase
LNQVGTMLALHLICPGYSWDFAWKQKNEHDVCLWCDAGQRFALREGGRTVGAGVVSKVIS